MKKSIKIILIIISIPIVLFGIFLLIATFKDYKPEPEELVYQSENPDILNDTIEYNLMIWNIGYCGLDKSMDFFYEDGEQVFPTEENHTANLDFVKNFVKEKSQNIDFFLLQEVDLKSKRSFKVNQQESINEEIANYHAFFGKNYDCFFVPIPVKKPYGKVLGGLVTFSKYEPNKSTRYSFEGNYSWPMRLFQLDRCFLVNRYNLENGKELLVINTHNSAFDDGTLRKKQMEYLKKFLLNEYEQGNYIIVGGDWNQCPPNFEPNFAVYQMDTIEKMDIAPDFITDWKFVYQNKIPTNRRVKTPFEKTETLTTVIDFFLISPNIVDLDIFAEDLEFEHSDHQPVFMKIKLK